MSKKSAGKVVNIKKGARRQDNGERWRTAAYRTDGWFNVLTGMGVRGQDKITSGDFAREPRLTDAFLEILYNGDDLAARIVDAVPEESMREGYEITIEPEDDGDAAEAKEMASNVTMDLEDRLLTTPRLVEGWAWGRLFGGGPIWRVVDDGVEDQALPMREDNIRRINALTVIDKWDLIPHTYYRDPAFPKFGEVETYRVHKSGPLGASGPVQIQGVEIHETRLLVFPGARTTMREKWIGEGWDYSVLQRVHAVLRQFNMSWVSLANMLQAASQGIFKVDSLIEMIGSEDTETLQTRMGLADAQRSTVRSLMIDAEKEEYEIASLNFAGIPDSMRVFLIRLAAAAKMPLTVLFGMSPAGLNSTGESDLRIWSATVKTQQTHVLKPLLTRLTKLNMLAKEGPTGGVLPERWDIVFPPLVKMTQAEEVQIRKTMAEADAIYIDRGVTFPEEVAINRFPMGGFSTNTSIETKDRQALLTAGPQPEPIDGPAPEPEPNAEPPVDPEAVDPSTALNGGQITALQAIVSDVASGKIPRATGVQLIAASFPLGLDEATIILADIEEPEERPTPPVPPPPPPPGTPVPPPAQPPPPGTPEEEDDEREDAKPYTTGEKKEDEEDEEEKKDGYVLDGSRHDQAAGHVHAIPPELQEQLGGAFTLPAQGLRHRHKLPNGGITGDAPKGPAHVHGLPFHGMTGRPVDPPAE